MSWIEVFATGFGLACVWLTVRQNIWCWPTGLVMVCLYAWIFFHARLYSDMGLQVIYVFMQIYGWRNWLRGGPKEDVLPVSQLSAAERFGWLAVAAASTATLGMAMRKFTNADVPFWDASTTVMSLIAQYLLARKALENWLFWIAVDVLSIGIYAYKGLYLTTGLYAVFLGLAIMGWFEWRRSLGQAGAVAAAA